MCMQSFQKIKSHSSIGLTSAFIPCGKCPDCRKLMQAGWGFRLRAELETLQRKGWWFAFCTLTYNDKCLPRLPFFMVKDEFREKYKNFPCFSKSDVKNFVNDLRQFLIRKYDCVRRIDKETKKVVKDEALRFMLCSEHGEATQRPHYHFIIGLPSIVPPRVVYDYIKERWNYGFVFPRCFEGGKDSHGYTHSPFVVDCLAKSCVYTAKYVCKDLSYIEKLDFDELNKEVEIKGEKKRLRDYMPFHYQSRGLGASYVNGLQEHEALKMLTVGASFVGEGKPVPLPLYLRNKLIFDNKYIIDADGKRLCLRQANEFFIQHYKELFALKRKTCEGMLLNWQFIDIERIFDKVVCYNLRYYKQLLDGAGRDLPSDIAAFWGVHVAESKNIEPSLFWLSRYDFDIVDNKYYNRDLSRAPRLDVAYHNILNQYCDTMAYAHSLLMEEKLNEKEITERAKSWIHDYYYSQE